jgi:probable phosphoglycerate mutase
LLVHVCFVRHGETTSNRDRILQGVTGDSPLTERGLKQARSAGEALRTQHAWDIILSSDLKRARTVCSTGHLFTIVVLYIILGTMFHPC